MALSLTVEETNFLRLVALTIGVAPRAVRCYFDGVFHPNNLQTTLLNQQKTIDNLRYRKKVLTSVQYNTLFHSGSAVTSKNLDITLMICLLRNISGIAPPVTGYDTLPSPSDISKGADLARIKHYRNKIAHSTDSKLLSQEFEDAWNGLGTAIGRLGGIVFQQECFSLKSSNLDSECYKDILLNIRHSQDEVSHTMANMVEALTKKTLDMENILQDTVPQNIRALYNNEISKWKQEDSKFVSTNQSKKILKHFDNEAFLTITGNSGVGKSFTTKHVALQLLSKGYDVLPVRKPFDILQFVSHNAKILFVFDDVCGKTHLLHGEIEDWERYSNDIANCIFGKDIKVFCNCRLQIFQSKEFESLPLLKKCQINLLTSEFTISEKRLIASKYISEEVLQELSDECIQAYDCFPLLCRMSKTWEDSKALTFLVNPFSVFENELELMKSGEKLNLCALLLVTIFNNNYDNGLLTADIDSCDRNTLDNVLEECGETRGTSRKLIKDRLDTMIGVYLMFEENSYRFANERLFEMTFTFMAKTFLKCVISHCSVSMLCDKFGLECLDEGRQHYQFFVPSDLEIYFFERLLKEANDNNFLDIFDCKQMHDEHYRTKFLAFCKTFDSNEICRIMQLSYFGIDILHLVSKRGYISFALFCFEKDVDINKYDDLGMTPLHTACKYENEQLVNLLLNAGARVNSYRSRGFTALFVACMSGKIHSVKHLLENQADPNLCSGRRLIPLLLASEKGYFEIAKLLIEFGADINLQDNKGFTALCQACISGHETIVEILLEYGAKINRCTSDGETPLHVTCSTSYNNIITMLVTKRADLLARSGKTGLTPVYLLQRDKKEVLINLLRKVISREEIYSMIEYALEENDKDLVEIILESHTDINGFMKSGKTALHKACLNGELEIANLLIENKANVNVCTMQGETVIQLSCLSSNCDLVQLLITKGAEIVDSNQSTILPLPLHIGCLLNDYEMCSLLLQNTVSTEVNKSVELTLYTAKELRNTKYIDYLLQKVGQWHNSFVTPLEIACLEQNIDIMRLLLNNGADPNSCFHTGSFPLALACIFENENMVELLLNNKSNVNTFTDIDDICTAVFQCGYKVDIVEKIAYKQFDTPTFPLSALHIASISNNTNIMQMLLNSKANAYEKCSISPMVLNVLSKKRKSAEIHEIAQRSYSKCSIIHNVLPLHIACLMGNDSIVDILIQNNTDYRPYYTESSIELSTEQVMCVHGLPDEFDLIPRQEETFMFSPIQIACFSTHWIILKKLFEYGAGIFETCDISNTLMACFSGNMKDLQNCKYQETVYKTSVENILFEHNHISIIRDLKDLGCRFGTNYINKMLETFVNSCYAGDLPTVGSLLNIIDDISIIHQNKAAVHYACESNQTEVVEFLVSHKAEVNGQAMNLETPMHIATRNECPNMIDLLIRNGGDPLLTNIDGDNALHIACMKDNTECLLLLLQFTKSGFISEECYYQEYIDMKNIAGMTPLSIAYDNKNKEILEILIQKGADIDKRYGPQHESLLLKACKDDKEDIVSLLLAKSASTNVYNIDRKTPLCISCCFSYDKITRILLEYNANVNISSYEGYSPLYYLCLNNNIEVAKKILQKGANTNLVLENTESLLIMSCKLNHPDIVDLLLQYNADVDYCHYSGETALYFAFEDGNVDIMRRLLNNHADLKVCKHERDFYLYLACKRGHYDLMNLLFVHYNEIDINKVIFNGETLLQTSINTNHLEIGKLLLKLGADINIHSSLFHQVCLHGHFIDIVDILNITSVHQTAIENELIWACGQSNMSLVRMFINSFFKDTKTIINVLYTGWFQAAKSSTEECMHLLYELGLDVNKKSNNDGHRAIHIACAAGNVDVVRFLMSCRNIKINSRSTFDKLTPLHLAITNGHDKVVRLLIEKNANVNAKTSSGKNAFFLACSYSHDNILSVLYELKPYDILMQFDQINNTYLEKVYMHMRSVLKDILCHFQVGYSVNGIDTVIHFACRMEDDELLNSLITANVNVNSTNAYGETPLLIAVSKQNLNIVLILLDAKANINVSCTVNAQGVQNLIGKNSIQKMENVLPIQLACLLDNEEIVSVLLNRNADCCSSFKMYHYSLKHEFQFEELSLVYIAVLSNNNQMLTMLLNNSLHPTCFRNVSIFSNTLIEKNHDFDGNTKYQSKLSLTPFQVALILDFHELVETFVLFGLADVNGKFKVTPLILSLVAGNYSSFIKVLDTYNIQDGHCETKVTPLLYATLIGNCKLVNILIANHASVTERANVSLLDIISIKPEITSLILSCRAPFSLVSRCLVHASFIALLKNDKDVLETSLPVIESIDDSTNITIIHFLCFRGYSDHLKIILDCNIKATNVFSIQGAHLISVSENIENYEYLSRWHPFTLNIAYFQLCCLLPESCVLKNLSRHPNIMEISVEVTPYFLSIFFGKSIYFWGSFNRKQLQSTFSINCLAWILYWRTHTAKQNHHLPDFVVADISNICVIEDSDLFAYHILRNNILNDHEDILFLDFLGIHNFNLRIILVACIGQDWNTVLQMMNFNILSNHYIHLDICDLFCLRNIESQYICWSNGIMLSALELEFLTHGSISNIFFHIHKAQEQKCFITSDIAACLHNSEHNLQHLMYKNTKIEISFTISCLHLFCFLDTIERMNIPYETFQQINLNAEIGTLHVACLKKMNSCVLWSLMTNSCVNTFATLSPLHIIMLTGRPLNLKEYTINENFEKAGHMTAVHILCFRQHNNGLKTLLHTKCDFNSIATNLTFLHLKFLTNKHICGNKYEKHYSMESELTPLHIASLIEDATVMLSIIRKTDKTDIICRIYPLHVKFKNNKSLAQFINSNSAFMLTAFHIACIQQNEEIAELLLRRKTDVHLPAVLSTELQTSEDKFISTHSEICPLQLACIMQNVTFTRMISSQVKTLNDICSISVWHICLFLNESRHFDKLCSLSEYRDSLCMLSPLNVACLCGNVSILTVLLKRGADSNQTAILGAPYAIIYDNYDAIVQLFLPYHYNVVKYPLHICAENGRTELCRVLLEFGADTNVETSFAHLKPWHLALYHGHKEMLSLLLQKTTKIDKKKFLIIFFMYLFRKKYNKQSGNTRIKVNRLVVLSLFQQCLPALKDIVFMKDMHHFEDSDALHYDDAMSTKLF